MLNIRSSYSHSQHSRQHQQSQAITRPQYTNYPRRKRPTQTDGFLSTTGTSSGQNFSTIVVDEVGDGSGYEGGYDAGGEFGYGYEARVDRVGYGSGRDGYRSPEASSASGSQPRLEPILGVGGPSSQMRLSAVEEGSSEGGSASESRSLGKGKARDKGQIHGIRFIFGRNPKRTGSGDWPTQREGKKFSEPEWLGLETLRSIVNDDGDEERGASSEEEACTLEPVVVPSGDIVEEERDVGTESSRGHSGSEVQGRSDDGMSFIHLFLNKCLFTDVVLDDFDFPK